MRWKINKGHSIAELGFIPQFLTSDDERSARDQIHEAYAHGGGWHSFFGFKFDPETKVLTYPEDPPYRPIASAMLRDEEIIVYPYAWVVILQKDGTFDAARLD